MSIRVVLADDHPMYRFGLAAILAQVDDVELVAEVEDGPGLLAAVAEHRPDVVVTDLSTPGLDGVEATRRLLVDQPDLGVLVVTMHEDDQHVLDALRAGARGYLVKGADGDEILRAVRAIAAGDAVYGGTAASTVLTSLRAIDEAGSPAGPPFAGLTQRESDVLELISVGCRNHEIARRLEMAEKTVRNHVSAILLKLQVPDRTAAAIKAREAGFGRGVASADGRAP